MSETRRPRPWRGVRPRRAFLIGFVIGLAVTVPAIFLALVTPVGEALLPLLTPGSLLLRPFADVMATWPGIVNVALVAIANGLIYGLIALAITSVRSLSAR